MAAGSGGGGVETTPTWIVALVCSAIIFISMLVERILHNLGKRWKKNNRKALHESLLKVKEELMLLGFISLMLALFQGAASSICIPESATKYMLPCKAADPNPPKQMHYQIDLSASNFMGNKRHLLAAAAGTDTCASKMRQWKRWEESITSEDSVKGSEFTSVQQHAFIKEHSVGHLVILSWLTSFLKQFYPGVTKSDYITLRLGFIQKHCQGNPKFNFHKYMVRTLEVDFKKVVGISWSLWIFVVIFLLLNVNGWNMYFWIAFIPLLLLLVVGTKLEHVITQLARDVVNKHTAIEGDLIVQLSDDHFWFHKPRLVLHIIHFILFQNAFEIAFFFWSLMGSSFRRAMFHEHVQESLVGWAQKAKKHKEAKLNTIRLGEGSTSPAIMRSAPNNEG
ncbi:MLO-like protein 1 [Nymphaea thermarum]|nr:MLO-like protein 1 [Nymphaea thermarum]